MFPILYIFDEFDSIFKNMSQVSIIDDSNIYQEKATHHQIKEKMYFKEHFRIEKVEMLFDYIYY